MWCLQPSLAFIIPQPQMPATLSAQLVTFRAFLVSFLFGLWGQRAVRYRFDSGHSQVQCSPFNALQ